MLPGLKPNASCILRGPKRAALPPIPKTLLIYEILSDCLPLSPSVLLIPNFLVFCANFSSKLNSSPRLRASAVQLVFSVSQCLRGGFWSLTFEAIQSPVHPVPMIILHAVFCEASLSSEANPSKSQKGHDQSSSCKPSPVHALFRLLPRTARYTLSLSL